MAEESSKDKRIVIGLGHVYEMIPDPAKRTELHGTPDPTIYVGTQHMQPRSPPKFLVSVTSEVDFNKPEIVADPVPGNLYGWEHGDIPVELEPLRQQKELDAAPFHQVKLYTSSWLKYLDELLRKNDGYLLDPRMGIFMGLTLGEDSSQIRHLVDQRKRFSYTAPVSDGFP